MRRTPPIPCAAALAPLPGRARDAATDGTACTVAMAEPERDRHRPSRMPHAVGGGGSGRPAPGAGLVASWSRTINVAGAGRSSGGETDAIASVETAQAAGVASTDAGGMRVSPALDPHGVLTPGFRAPTLAAATLRRARDALPGRTASRTDGAGPGPAPNPWPDVGPAQGRLPAVRAGLDPRTLPTPGFAAPSRAPAGARRRRDLDHGAVPAARVLPDPRS